MQGGKGKPEWTPATPNKKQKMANNGQQGNYREGSSGSHATANDALVKAKNMNAHVKAQSLAWLRAENRCFKCLEQLEGKASAHNTTCRAKHTKAADCHNPGHHPDFKKWMAAEQANN